MDLNENPRIVSIKATGEELPIYEIDASKCEEALTGRRRSNAFSFSNIDEDNNCSENAAQQELILSSTLSIVKPKDFANEVRCQRDIDAFVKDSCILLNCEEIDLGSIVSKMLNILLEGYSHSYVNEAKNAIFAQSDYSLLANTLQGIYVHNDGQYSYNQSWICIYGSLSSLKKRRVGIVKLKQVCNFGVTTRNIQFVIIVLSPHKEKMTKNAEEASRVFATLFADASFRMALLSANDERQFVSILEKRAQDLGSTQLNSQKDVSQKLEAKEVQSFRFGFCNGLIDNIKRRSKLYISDYVDGFVGQKTVRKTIATIAFLYCACLLPCIAFGVLNDKNTSGRIDARRTLIGQAIGGFLFAIFAGQPLVIIMTTAPLCLYTKVVFDIANDMEVDFYAMFACTGLWNSFFVIMYAIFDVSTIMKWCTRSTEEIFSLFIFFAFCVDAIKECVISFEEHYCFDQITANESDLIIKNMSFDGNDATYCSQQTSILFLLLMLATVWFAVVLFDFNKTPYLNGNKRELLQDYALPISVLVFSFVGTFLFRDVRVDPFNFGNNFQFSISAKFNDLKVDAIFVCMGLGFFLSLLFFMDQNISAALVNNPNNNLKKGNGYHLDLLIVALLNAFMSLFGLPWMHGILPHSPLHARCLADIEQHIDDGHIREVVVRVRETRVTGIVTHILIALSLLLIPHPLDYIPVSVLSGLFLYCAVAALRGNCFFERILLFITEQSSYPPTHYIRRCPQKKIHYFTSFQIIQLAVLCFFGFAPWAYVQMAFPIIVAILIPIRWKIIPWFIEHKYIEAIDGYH